MLESISEMILTNSEAMGAIVVISSFIISYIKILDYVRLCLGV